jgi:hypothetical protein
MALTDNLVAAYECNEASSSDDATDAANGHTLTQTASPGTTTGKQGGGRTFNGSSQYFSGSLLSGSKANLSIEAWINRSTGGLCFGWLTTSGNRFGPTLIGGTLYTCLENGAANYGTMSYSLTGWRHLVVVYDGSLSGDVNRLKVYIDATQQTLSFPSGTPLPATYTITGNFTIARDQSDSAFGSGTYDLVRVWDRSLTGAEVTSLNNSGNGLPYSSFGGGGGGSANPWYYRAQQEALAL